MTEQKVYRRQLPSPPAVDEESGILFISVDRIRPNRAQPRKRFDTNAMIRLADSVRRYGILQPLTVRIVPKIQEQSCISDPKPVMYELIAGERRLRAAKLAGLTHVPCILASADDHLSAELAVIENLLREDLNMFEQARAFGCLMLQFSLTQEQVARKMSMSQSAVANKLRLLRFDEDEQRAILENKLTERHARALLRLPSNKTRIEIIRQIALRHMNVASTEEYVEKLLASDSVENIKAHHESHCVFDVSEDDHRIRNTQESEGQGRKKLVLQDLRLFYNSLEKAVGILKQTGLVPKIEKQEEGGRLEIHISVDCPCVADNVVKSTDG